MLIDPALAAIYIGRPAEEWQQFCSIAGWPVTTPQPVPVPLAPLPNPPAFAPLPPAAPAFSGVTVKRGDQYEEQRTRWLWSGFIALDALQLLGGIAGTSKTTCAMQIASTVSTGGTWPDGHECEPGSVLIWTGEDSKDKTLIPRLRIMGADLSQVYFVEHSYDQGTRRSFDPATDMLDLERAAAAIDGLSLIILDPVVNVVSGDSHHNTEVRRSMQPVCDLAERTGAAVLGITHLSKGTSGREPLERVTGSLAFGAVARLVLFAVRYKDEQLKCHLIRIKNNLGPTGDGFAYDIKVDRDENDPEDQGISSIEWGEQLYGSAKTLLDAAAVDVEPRGPKPTARNEAEQWLRKTMADCTPYDRRELLEAAEDAGLVKRTVERAAARLIDSGVIVSTGRQGNKGGKGGAIPGTWQLAAPSAALAVLAATPIQGAAATVPEYKPK